MSQKRKFEEFHDPDYPQNNDVKRKCTTVLSADEKQEKIRAIVRREFQRELASKEDEITKIDNRIIMSRILLHKVRYAIVADCYNKKVLDECTNLGTTSVTAATTNTNTLPAQENSGTLPQQNAIHPAIKNILGKQPANYDDLLKIRPTREAAKTAKTSIKEKLRTKKEEKLHRTTLNGKNNINISVVATDDDKPKVPRYIDPIKVDKPLPQLNTARGRNQIKHLIVVGNTSKYIGDEMSLDGVTHKWLVYVRTKDGIPIEKFVTKAKFFLHPSYKPNDIVDVCMPPFQLSRRGWGEFPVRIQLHFDDRLQQKPVQLVHNLVLDKSLTGLQTLGAETVVEMWLGTDALQDNKNDLIEEKEKKPCLVANNDINEILDDRGLQQLDQSLYAWLNTKSSDIPAESPVTKTLIKIEQDKGKLDDTTEINSIESEALSGTNLGASTTITTTPIIIPTNLSSQTTISSLMDKQSSETSDIQSQSNCQFKILPKIEPNTGTNKIVNPNNLQVSNSQLNNIFTKKLYKLFNKEGKPIFVEKLVRSPADPSKPPVIKPTYFIQKLNNGEQKSKIIINNIKNTKIFGNNLNNNIITSTLNAVNIKSIATSTENSTIINNKNPTILLQNINSSGSCNSLKTTSYNNINNTDNQIPMQFKLKPNLNGLQNQNKLTNCIISKSPVMLQQSSNSCTTNQSPTQKVFQNIVAGSSSSSNSSSTSSSYSSSYNLQKQSTVPVRNQVILKNGKMYIIDPMQTKLKQQAKKQESLLKPQISLLKPIVKNDNLNNCIRNEPKQIFNHTSIATDHDYTSLMGKSPAPNTITIRKPISVLTQNHHRNNTFKTSILPINTPNNSRINVIVKKIENDLKLLNKKPAQSISKNNQKANRDYKNELLNKFNFMKFSTVRTAVEYLFKRVPLFNAAAAGSNTDYVASFPFVVSSEQRFEELMTPKRRSNEWLRAKLISNMLIQHPDFKITQHWTTKEIILFGRQYAYTPAIVYTKTEKNDHQEKLEISSSSLRDLVKQEIDRDRFDDQTLTVNHDIYDWFNKTKQKLKEEDNSNVMEDIINVDESDEEDHDKTRKNFMESPLKNYDKKIFMTVKDSLQAELSFVSETCQEIGVRLKPEEILPDVIHSSSHLVLAQTLRCFLDDLLHRSIAVRNDPNQPNSLKDIAIYPEDIKKAVTSRSHFDFLTNSDLGVSKPKQQID